MSISYLCFFASLRIWSLSNANISLFTLCFPSNFIKASFGCRVLWIFTFKELWRDMQTSLRLVAFGQCEKCHLTFFTLGELKKNVVGAQMSLVLGLPVKLWVSLWSGCSCGGANDLLTGGTYKKKFIKMPSHIGLHCNLVNPSENTPVISMSHFFMYFMTFFQ